MPGDVPDRVLCECDRFMAHTVVFQVGRGQSLTLRIRSPRLSSKPLNPFSISRLRFCSACFATVFEFVFADSRIRRCAKINSYHHVSPRLKTHAMPPSPSVDMNDSYPKPSQVQVYLRFVAAFRNQGRPGIRVLSRVGGSRDIQSGRSAANVYRVVPSVPTCRSPVVADFGDQQVN